MTWPHHPGEIPVLDIGGDIGAIVAYLADRGSRGELDARPAGRPDEGFHTGIHPRSVAGLEVLVAVFPAVHSGDYELLDDAGAVVAPLRVAGGAVTEVDLREVTARAAAISLA